MTPEKTQEIANDIIHSFSAEKDPIQAAAESVKRIIEEINVQQGFDFEGRAQRMEAVLNVILHISE
jgi:hypothetical protein